jgi:hypothetical protein
MDLARKPFIFSDGRTLQVSESTWESSSIRSRYEEQARSDRARLNGSGDPTFLFFLESFYSFLASCSSGDVPGPEEAFALTDEDLDRWYRTVTEVNPESFLKVDYDKTGEVTFRDGRSFRIVSSYLPSVLLRRSRLEEEGLKKEADPKNPKDVFAIYLYPILASCSIGDIPDPEEIRSTWPETEIYKWRDAVEEINPHLFGSNGAQVAKESQDIQKKREKRPRK